MVLSEARPGTWGDKAADKARYVIPAQTETAKKATPPYKGYVLKTGLILSMSIRRGSIEDVYYV